MSDPIVAMAANRIARGSKSFAGAARLFDADTRASAFMLYAWCRHCDDEIDGQVLGFQRAPASSQPLDAVLAELRAKTLAATRGQAEEPIYIALQRVVQKHAIPPQHPLDLIRGMEMDVEMETAGLSYQSLDGVLEYCYHVAGVVGVMMAMVMGVSDKAVLLRASDLGIAFQLTNIVRDVVPDAEVGRVYLPADMMQAHGLDETSLALPANRAKVFAIAEALLDTAERYYASAEAGVPHLPFRSAWAVAAARRVYRDIGALVRARGPAAWDQRVATSSARKFAGVALAGRDASLARSPARGARAASRAGLWTPSALS